MATTAASNMPACRASQKSRRANFYNRNSRAHTVILMCNVHCEAGRMSRKHRSRYRLLLRYSNLGHIYGYGNTPQESSIATTMPSAAMTSRATQTKLTYSHLNICRNRKRNPGQDRVGVRANVIPLPSREPVTALPALYQGDSM